MRVTGKGVIEKIHDILMKGRRVKVREIADTEGVSSERLRSVLHEGNCR